MYQAVIFDLDGTLVNSLYSLAYCGNYALERLGLPPQAEEAYQYFAGDGPEELTKRALLAAGGSIEADWEKMYAEYQQIFKTHCNDGVKIYDGLKEVLDAMKRRGTKFAVVTNKPQEGAEKVIGALFGENYMDVVVGSSPKRPRKPDKAQVIYAIERLGTAKENCMYVGDTDVDMQTGKAADIFTVGVLWGFRDRQELEKNNADAIAGNPAELQKIWEK